MKIFGLVGWSGSGKTELLIQLLPELRRRGLKVSTMKHTHHNVDIDIPGKDSYRHRQAGAEEVMVASSGRWSLVHELRDEPEPDMDFLIAQMKPVDLLLIEGFKRNGHPKMEVFRPSCGEALIADRDPTVVGVASDEQIVGLDVPLIDLNDVSAVADFIIARTGAQPSANTAKAAAE